MIAAGHEDNEFELWWAEQLLKIPLQFRQLTFWRTRLAKIVADQRNPSTIRNWISEGKIVGRRVGSSWRVSVASLKQYLKQTWNADL